MLCEISLLLLQLVDEGSKVEAVSRAEPWSSHQLEEQVFCDLDRPLLSLIEPNYG